MMRSRQRARGVFAGWLGLTALVLIAGVAGGCRPDFAPYNRITGLRVLAIRSEPAAPITGETATFSALVVTPSAMPAPAIAYQWSWCPFAGDANKGYRCVLDEQTINDLLMANGQTARLSFDLGTAPTASFINNIPADSFKQICDTGVPGLPMEFKLDCAAGFPIQIMLTVTTATDSLTAVQTVKLRFDDQQPANTNPAIDGLQVVFGSDAGDVIAPIPDPTADPNAPAVDPVTLPRDRETRIRATMAETTAEVYAGFDDDKQPATLKERLFLTWFVESGDTSDPRTSYFPDSTLFANMLRNFWTPGKVKDYPPDSSRIYVVAHDNRGGVSWRPGTVNLEPTP